MHTYIYKYIYIITVQCIYIQGIQCTYMYKCICTNMKMYTYYRDKYTSYACINIYISEYIYTYTHIQFIYICL